MTVDVTEGRLDALRLSDAEMVFSDLDAKRHALSSPPI